MAIEPHNATASLDAPSPNGQRPRSPAEIEAEIERTRLQLQSTVDAIAERVKPANLARSGAEAAKAQLVEPDGRLRTARVAALAAGLAAVAGYVVWRRRH